ncbi:methyltransferase domain-containing protein [Flavobacterium sp. LHD-80]|uniref:class I SAM-dependent DNA methyltransferase n=1 Tax=Flavobacterium sp. LHD-80 TaxID=3071411 RepID=UPI0027E0F38F|nr:methyltransferase domain-containing protein [Flavobacterium sp. LHD-80]MDQ6471850.1 methyltransferase domain-containing protein [Flavobacterium sp. LHD-80]
MNKYKETFETWNKIANLYEDKFMNLSLYDETYDFFCDALKPDQLNIFEIGCGPGNITKYLLSKKPNLQIKGIDIAPKMIELAKANNPSAEFKVMDTRELSSLNQKFDAILCGFCLPYLSKEDCSKLITDSEKILLNNGILYLSFVQGKPSESGFISGSTGDRTYFYYHTLEDISNQLLINNFEVLKLFEINYPKGEFIEIHTIIIANKIEKSI